MENVLYRHIEPCIMFVAEIRVNFENGDFRTYSVIDKCKEHMVERIKLTTYIIFIGALEVRGK